VVETAARRKGLLVEPMNLGERSDGEIKLAMHELVESGMTVVCLITLETDVKRVLQMAKAAIQDAGLDYSEYTWIIGNSDTQVLGR
jgi:hypothetical protein